MSEMLERERFRKHLENFDLQRLFIEELGWDFGGADTEVSVEDDTFGLEAVAHKRGMVVYKYAAESDDTFPNYPTRRKIERNITKTVREHIIVYSPRDKSASYWEWVKREPGRSDRVREHIHYRDSSGEVLFQKLDQLRITIDEEEDLTIVDVASRVRAAFDVERVTRKFFKRFKDEHRCFLDLIEGIESKADREWYASLMLNRLMFVYFIQKRGFLNSDTNYLSNRLRRMQRKFGKDRFQTFYRLFMLRLFHEGLGQPEGDRRPDIEKLLGKVPYLNGGLFDVHDLEQDNPDIHIPDEAFERIFSFFEQYQWHLDDRPLRKDTEINPDVLGFIFEKYVNQKQMGAYYTKEDITGYISRSTVIPFLFKQANVECPIAFAPRGGVWKLLSDDPDRYIFESVRHGITYDIHRRDTLAGELNLPSDIGIGLKDAAKRKGWNNLAPDKYGLPTETWREHIARRQQYEHVRAKLVNGEINSINDLTTYNLDIEKFTQDVIAWSEGPELVRAFWQGLEKVSILDPTCGSGAFLFSALNILEPIYTTCLEAMRGFLDDLERRKHIQGPERMSDFRQTLERVAEHASERYFILKSIIVHNLYGVDIMDEAVEICKLRLFLTLVAQLESYDQIEPLPDIDFNIRAGNSLVGYAKLKELQDAFVVTRGRQRKMLYAPDELRQIEEDAQIADREFREFREMQTQHDIDASIIAAIKSRLKTRLDVLRAKLDYFLAREYGVRTDDEKALRQWHNNYHPFHWFVEFYGIMLEGGFDVIIGNPPYITYPSKKVTYGLERLDYRTLSTKNLYAMVFERSISLGKQVSPVGFIVQLTCLASKRLVPLQSVLLNRGLLHALSFPRRPQSIFEGVEMPVSILLSTPNPVRHLYTTKVRRFYRNEKAFFIDSISMCEHNVVLDGHRIAKFGTRIDTNIYKKIASFQTYLGSLASKARTGILYYQEACRYWVKAANRRPFFRKNGTMAVPSHWRKIPMISKEAAAFATCILNSSLFYWYYSVFSDCEHVNDGLVRNFPIPGGWESVGCDWQRLCSDVMSNLDANSKIKSIRTKQGHVIEYAEMFGALSKGRLDLVDDVLATIYGLTNEELDYVVQYDEKYRVGRMKQIQ